MINPDGVSISQMGLEGCLTEETRERVLEISRLDGAQDMNAYLRRWKSNSRGVDLNRNFDALWESYNDGLGRPSADHYKGTAPGSEPEAAALAALRQWEADCVGLGPRAALSSPGLWSALEENWPQTFAQSPPELAVQAAIRR